MRLVPAFWGRISLGEPATARVGWYEAAKLDDPLRRVAVANETAGPQGLVSYAPAPRVASPLAVAVGDPPPLVDSANHGGIGSIRAPFAIAIVDRVTRGVTLARDASGAFPLYFRVLGSMARWGTVLDDVAAEGSPNDAFLLDHLAGSPTAPYETPYRDTFQVPPGCVVTIRPEGSWTVTELREPAPSVSARDFRHEFDRRFTSVVDELGATGERAGRDVAVRLSGGVDSTAVATAVRSTSRDPRLLHVHFRARGADELDFARAAADALQGVLLVVEPHVGRASGAGWYRRSRASPFAEPYEAEVSALYRTAARRRWRFVLSGSFGDEFCAGLDDRGDPEVEVAVRLLRRRLRHELPPAFLLPRGVELFVDGLERHFTVPRQCLVTTARWGVARYGEVLYETTLRFGVCTASPFLTRPMLDLAAAMPAGLRSTGGRFKPVLRGFLRSRGVHRVASRSGKASLHGHFHRVYRSTVAKRLTAPALRRSLEAWGYVDPRWLARPRLQGLPCDALLALWQVGEFLVRARTLRSHRGP